MFLEDINFSCVREIKEESGLDAKSITLKGVIKTILEGKNSSWILFIYTSSNFTGDLIDCNECQLNWIDKDKLFSENLIGFIKRILPNVLEENEFIEGTIIHDMEGNVLDEKITISSLSHAMTV